MPWIIVLGLAVIIPWSLVKKWLVRKGFALKVSTEKVEIRDITEIITANGKLKPLKEVKISPEVPGEIIELPVKEGEKVKKGDLLVVIKPDIYQSSLSRIEASLNTQKARLAQAEAQLIEREHNYQRAKQLLETKTIPKSEFETVEAAWKVAISEVQAARYSVKSAESSVKEANENLTKTKIFSPIDGTVSKLNVEKGKVVGTNQFAGTELMTVADLNTMEVKVEVNENDIVKVQKLDTANIEIDAYLKRKFKGIVTEIASSANVTGTTVDQVTNFNVKIVLLAKSYQDLIEKDTLKYPFLPGMSATVEILTDTRKGIISVPIQAVTTRGDDGTVKKASEQMEKVGTSDTNAKEVAPKEPEQHEVVFVIRNNLAWKKRVKTGIQDNTRIEILEGLAVGDEVIVAPYGLISKTLKDSSPFKSKIEDLYQIKK